MGAEERDFLLAQQGSHKHELARKPPCFRYILRTLPKLRSVLELFGGTGVMYGVLEELYLVDSNTYHSTWEISRGCVEELMRKFPGHDIQLVDSFKQDFPDHYELISADFNTFTPLKAHRQPRYARLLKRIFNSRPEFVHITDSSPNKLHLNAPHYERFFGRPVDDVPSYARAASDWYYQQFGYRIVRAAYHSNALYCLLARKGRLYSIPRIR